MRKKQLLNELIQVNQVFNVIQVHQIISWVLSKDSK